MNRLIDTIIDTGSYYCNAVSLSEAELESRKATMHIDALKFLSENDVDYIVYYHDNRSEAGEILRATLHYNMVGLSKEQFDSRSKEVSGQIGYVTRLAN